MRQRDQMVVWINYWPHLVNRGWPSPNLLEHRLDWEEAKSYIREQNRRNAVWTFRVLCQNGFERASEHIKTCHPMLTDEERRTQSELLCLDMSDLVVEIAAKFIPDEGQERWRYVYGQGPITDDEMRELVERFELAVICYLGGNFGVFAQNHPDYKRFIDFGRNISSEAFGRFVLGDKA